MAENSNIEWCDHTFNPWVGCSKISPACDHCYAEAFTARFKQVEWGPGKPRKRTSAANWRKPLKWNRDAAAFAEKHGRKQRVFCASLADVFDNAVDLQWRADLFALIDATPNLDWLLLTKRIGNVVGMLNAMGRECLPPQVWLGATICNQAEAERDVPKLLDTPAAVRFLSCEPLLSMIDLSEWFNGQGNNGACAVRSRNLLDGQVGEIVAAPGSGHSNTTEEGGYRVEQSRRISSPTVHDGRQALCGRSPSNCVDDLNRAPNSERHGDQSSQRDKVGQSPRKSRGSHARPEHGTQFQGVGAEGQRSARAEEYLVEIRRNQGAYDPRSSFEERTDATGASRTVRSVTTDNLGNLPSQDLATRSLIDWIIVGGESGAGARPMHPDWARSLRDQCGAAGVPFLFKQWGEWVTVSEVEGPGEHYQFPDFATVRRVGKTRAGRLLDGREWNGFPGPMANR